MKFRAWLEANIDRIMFCLDYGMTITLRESDYV